VAGIFFISPNNFFWEKSAFDIDFFFCPIVYSPVSHVCAEKSAGHHIARG
jgi:hypothetical protein